ncbi:PREDICTED: uncharacterized protein LOC109234773 [Nicotiana attenuata]|uniref:uncharacterized protein LOC109234773 n=1 Tax=Nicotiana attenuata TaxID=49451 RepID=UPI00090500C9|nr:PREDICTED: uncharacterized protein LOC109234773 [Nicotiana attenuata]
MYTSSAMDNRITILVQHSGQWDMQHRFKNFSVDGVVISMEWDFKSIRSEISKILGVDAQADTMDIGYSVKENFPPMKIYDNRSLGLYMELKSKNLSFTDYPLCITFKKQDNDGTCANPVVNKANSNLFQNLSMVDNLETIDEECIIGISTHQEVNEGQLYKNKDILQNVMKHLAIREKFQFKVDRSNKTRYYLVCVDDQCSWNLKASSLNTSNIFKVRKFEKVHTCGNNSRLFSQRQATSDLVGSLIMNKLDDPKLEYTPAEIQRDLKRDYGVDLNYMKAWRSREKAFEMLRGKPSDSYNKLPRFLNMLMHTNPGSVTRLERSDDGCFLYVYVALFSSIKGWEYCMPNVVVDGSFLKSTYRGTLLTTCTQDAAGKIFPLAYAVVNSENDASWEWFFRNLRETYGIREGMCIVSDRHESILKATSVVYPEVPHCVCIFHLWNNIKLRFKKSQKKIRPLFFAMAKAYTIEEFNQYMSEIRNLDGRVKEYLFDIGYDRWSVAHSTVNRSMVMTSNIAESMNSANKAARDLPIYDLLDYLMKLVAAWNNTNRNGALATGTTLSTKLLHQMKTYEFPVYPIPDESQWEILEYVLGDAVKPPNVRVKPGRPKKSRIKGAVSILSGMSCHGITVEYECEIILPLIAFE